jgi:predicted SprT family Zn-dependent metalloprotease
VADYDEVISLAEHLIEVHLADKKWQWTFFFDHAVRRVGACHHDTKRISLSRHYVDIADIDDVKQTLLHEVAHAMVGKRHNHSQQWLDTARSIGYTGWIRHEGASPTHLARWRGTCPNGHEVLRFRRPRNFVASCIECYPRYDERYLITWEWID